MSIEDRLLRDQLGTLPNFKFNLMQDKITQAVLAPCPWHDEHGDWISVSIIKHYTNQDLNKLQETYWLEVNIPGRILEFWAKVSSDLQQNWWGKSWCVAHNVYWIDSPWRPYKMRVLGSTFLHKYQSMPLPTACAQREAMSVKVRNQHHDKLVNFKLSLHCKWCVSSVLENTKL